MMSYLPDDLVDEILLRVPARSLKQLTCICKRWNALIKDRGFKEKHFRKAAKESMVLMCKGHRVFLVSINLNVSPPSIEFKGTPGLKYKISSTKQVHIVEVFHCDGLLLCNTKDRRLMVWNPCSGETRWIKLKAVNKYSKYALRYQNTRYGDRPIFATFALGYESNKSCRSYKILRCWCYYNYSGYQVVGYEIYEFSSDSWRVLNGLAFHQNVCSFGVSLKGNAYWLANDEEGKHEFLLSVDFTEEKLKRLCLPPVDNFSACRAISVVGEEQLSVLKHSSNNTSKMEIWVTNKIDSDDTEAVLKWSKYFTVDLPNRVYYISYGMMTFTVDKEKKVVVCCSDLSKNPMFIIGEDHKYYKKMSFGESNYKWKYMYNYVPNLVQIQ